MYTPFRRVVSTWYVAMVTGRISLRVPEYSPISSSVSDVRLTSSSRHCRALTVLVTRMSVVVDDFAMAPAPTSVLPAPQGSTTTPEPPCQKFSTAWFWYGRSDQPSSASAMGCASPSTYPARSSAGQPSLSSTCLRCPRSDLCTITSVSSTRAPSRPAVFLDRMTSTSTAGSSACRTSPCTGCWISCRRP